MSYEIWSYPSRTVCAVLDEMRACIKTANYSYLPGLVEEMQVLGNRMEAGLEDSHSLAQMHEKIKKLRKEISKLDEEKKSKSSSD